jgi:3-oxoacyl-[acyl-carrier-protein] synthase-3
MKKSIEKSQTYIGIETLAYKLPKTKKSLSQLEQQGALISPMNLLQDFGFGSCFIQESHNEFEGLILSSAKKALSKSKSDIDSISQLFWYSGIEVGDETKHNDNVLNLFRYPVSRLRHELGLTKANSIALSQQGCGGLLSSIYLAKQLLVASEVEKDAVLCVAADVFPHWAKREIMYNIMSDAAAALVVSKDAGNNRIVHFHQTFQSYYWDTPRHEDELLASYFPIAQRTIEDAVHQAGLTLADIKWFVPHNVSLKSWEILAKLLNVPIKKIWTNNIARIGHTVSCDHIINLVDMESEGVLNEGDYLALFTFGFGANWSCLILQH